MATKLDVLIQLMDRYEFDDEFYYADFRAEIRRLGLISDEFAREVDYAWHLIRKALKHPTLLDKVIEPPKPLTVDEVVRFMSSTLLAHGTIPYTNLQEWATKRGHPIKDLGHGSWRDNIREWLGEHGFSHLFNCWSN